MKPIQFSIGICVKIEQYVLFFKITIRDFADGNKNPFFFADMSFSDEEDDTDEQVSIPGLDHPGALPMMGGHPMGATPPHLTPGNMSDHSSSSAHTLTPTPNKYETNNNSLQQQQPPMVSPHTKDSADKDLDEMDDDLKGDDDGKGKITIKKVPQKTRKQNQLFKNEIVWDLLKKRHHHFLEIKKNLI